MSKEGLLPCPVTPIDQTTPKRANTCTGLLPTTVRGQTVIFFSSNTPYVQAAAGQASFTSIAARAFNFDLTGDLQRALPMPSGTSIAITSSVAGCTIGVINPTAVQNGVSTRHSVMLTGTAGVPDVTCNGAILTINTTSPSGQAGSATVTVP